MEWLKMTVTFSARVDPKRQDAKYELELLRHPYHPSHASSILDLPLLASALPQLTRLAIVAGRPSLVQGGSNSSLWGEYIKAQMKEWASGNREILSHIVHRLPESIDI